MSIKAIDKASIHHITSGQVVIDLQTAVKELVENSVDAGATSIEVRFRNYGLSSIEVVDNGCGIAEDDYESIALKHHTSKLETFSDLTSVETFGFRGEALSSLCALSEQVSISTATASTTPMGTSLVLDSSGKLLKRSAVARNQGTSITLTNIFSPLAVRRKELERNIKREFAKALSLLNAYALGPCAAAPGIRLTVTNQQEKGGKSTPIRTLGLPSCRESVTALWGPKSLDNIVDVDITFEVEREKVVLKRLQNQELEPFTVQVRGLTSKFSVGCGRAGTDRQFFYVNGRPCNMNKIQKCFNEVYRSFNATQAPFIVANIMMPTHIYDVNVSPDKRTILLHSEANLISALKVAFFFSLPYVIGLTTHIRLLSRFILRHPGQPLISGRRSRDPKHLRRAYFPWRRLAKLPVIATRSSPKRTMKDHLPLLHPHPQPLLSALPAPL
ncbi:hypothetical protein HYPSUDRAFT_147287 [Hypholoma sublateritium FD-334 SS-4]|uniref:DNA mismatch repair protein S5 domain-containing protein n=1 Tax=Hypholoma sublateritium (strain FD-334 SS-4) TaxID=945553 RepID=A0A0D2M0M0_HYPSF|nr:hypothetical protein HYPSUDRAFT_147287 [Hypholoma sublateritium FD-334 SS-4]